MKLSATVNGVTRDADVFGLKRLLDVLREDWELTGTKEGCGEGECGACSVLVNGELVNSCLVAASQIDGCEIRTVEGLEAAGASRLQKAFVEAGGAQCGICTPGMLVSAHALLSGKRPVNEETVRDALAGNLCRCTGYTKIIEGVMKAAE